MKKTRKKITAMLNAITFAESGERETAAQFLSDSLSHEGKSQEDTEAMEADLSSLIQESIDKPMAAITFAEESLFREARSFMKSHGVRTVLLVIEGEFPREAAFNYAKNLCDRTKSQLDILQVISPPSSPESIEVLGGRMSEAVTNIVQLLQKCDLQTSMPKLTIRLGHIDSKLLNYVKRHQEVSAVVLDSKEGYSENLNSANHKDFLKGLSRRLSVPLMTVLDRLQAQPIG